MNNQKKEISMDSKQSMNAKSVNEKEKVMHGNKKPYVAPTIEHRVVESEHSFLLDQGSVAPTVDTVNGKEEKWVDEDSGFNQDFWI